MAEKGNGSEEIAEFCARAANSSDAEEGQSLDDYLSSPISEVDFGYYAKLSTCKDFSDFKERIDTEINHFGFSDYSFVRLCNTDCVDSQALVSFSKEFLDSYYCQDFYEHDVIVPYAESKNNPIYRSMLEAYVEQAPFESDMTRAMAAIYQLNKSFGYYDFYNVPTKAKTGAGKVMLSVADRGCSPHEFKEKIKCCGSTLQLLCEAIDFVTTRRYSDIFFEEDEEDKKTVSINPRPLRVLDTLANSDLNIAQVADKLCISVVTANKHLETARKAFGARTNYAAIKKAVLNGLIEYTK